MKRSRRVASALIGVMIFVLAGIRQGNITQALTGEPALLIGQVKLTSSNGQFVSLYNNSDHSINMSKVQLAYYNNYDLSASPASKIINLSGELAQGNYYLVSDDSFMVCYKMIVHSASLAFSTSGGMLQVLQLTQGVPGGQVSSVLMDWIAWAKASTTGALKDANGAWTLPKDPNSFLNRTWPSDQVKASGAGSWQMVSSAGASSCELQAQMSLTTTPSAASTPSAVKAAATEAPMLNMNAGLVAPELTELFPNPASPQTDENDEFIELYNPNTSVYDLTGYRLEAGSTYSKGYTFKSGKIEPKSFASFSINETKLQLTNSEGQVRLLDREGNTISETAPYEDAPAGSSWSLVSDSWQWTTKPSPGVINTSSAEVDEGGTTATSSAKKATTGKVAGASTGSSEIKLDDAAPLHPLVLAGVGLSAVAYALYEYRRDMANRLFQLRRYLRTRRAVRARV